MNEGVKTLVFSLLAVVVVVVAYATRPRNITPEDIGGIGEPLFADFKNPADARELKISRFDETQGEFKEFEIAQKDGRWVIPSHNDYPADAEAQLKEAALCLIDLIVVDTISDAVEDHKDYGLVEPNPEKLRAGDQGVGVLVSMKGADGKNLAKLIISEKKVEGHSDKRFVRKPGEDRVYVVKIDPSKLSTKFSDWIEKDLLKLNAFDVEQLVLKDYSVAMVMTDAGPQVRNTQRFELTASQEASGPGWKLDKLTNFQGRNPVPAALGESEELNSQKLDDIKSALDNLQIVDVRKKPKGLGANLRADEGLLKDREGLQSLMSLGFLPLKMGTQGAADIFAANGEVVVRLKDGAEYVIRFGNSAGAEEGSDATKLNRYVLVTAQVSESKFPPLVLEPLPEEPADEPAAPKEEAGKEDAKKEDAKKEGDDKPDEAKQQEDAKKAAERKKAELKAARDRITKENKRKEDEYKANRKKAEDKVKELNARFADWYYVISEDVYKKVHLSRVDLIKEKTGVKDEGFGVDAFRKLEEGGLKGEPEKKSGFDPSSGAPPGLPPGLGGLPPDSGE